VLIIPIPFKYSSRLFEPDLSGGIEMSIAVAEFL
jgi:hypothetical protein